MPFGPSRRLDRGPLAADGRGFGPDRRARRAGPREGTAAVGGRHPDRERLPGATAAPHRADIDHVRLRRADHLRRAGRLTAHGAGRAWPSTSEFTTLVGEPA